MFRHPSICLLTLWQFSLLRRPLHSAAALAAGAAVFTAVAGLAEEDSEVADTAVALADTVVADSEAAAIIAASRAELV